MLPIDSSSISLLWNRRSNKPQPIILIRYPVIGLYQTNLLTILPQRLIWPLHGPIMAILWVIRTILERRTDGQSEKTICHITQICHEGEFLLKFISARRQGGNRIWYFDYPLRLPSLFCVLRSPPFVLVWLLAESPLIQLKTLVCFPFTTICPWQSATVQICLHCLKTL
jgi:hypothetical protein